MQYRKIGIALFIIIASFTCGHITSCNSDLITTKYFTESIIALFENLKTLSEGMKLSDFVSSISAILTLILAFKAYRSWLSQQINTDSYMYAKNYLSKSSEIKETIREIQRHYNHLHLKAGMIPITKEECAQRLILIEKLSESLYQSTLKLIDARSELQFWVVSLTELFDEKHEIIINHLNQLQTVMPSYCNQLHRYHIEEKKNTKDVDNEELFFNKHLKAINEAITSRHDVKFTDMFKLK